MVLDIQYDGPDLFFRKIFVYGGLSEQEKTDNTPLAVAFGSVFDIGSQASAYAFAQPQFPIDNENTLEFLRLLCNYASEEASKVMELIDSPENISLDLPSLTDLGSNLADEGTQQQWGT